MLRLPSLFERMIEPLVGDFSPEHARYILSLGFSELEQSRCEELSMKAQQGALTPEERAGLEEFVTANSLLMLLQSKARRSLVKRPPAA